MKLGRLPKVIIHPAFWVYFGSMAALASWQASLFSACSLVIHEVGHLIAALALGGPVRSVTLTPFGGVMVCGEQSLKGVRGLLIALGGPAANLLSLFFLGTKSAAAVLSPESARWLASANVLMAVLNALPALPLDGGNAVFALGYFLFPIAHLVFVLCTMGMILGLAILCLAGCGLWMYGTLNCSLLIVGIWLMICAKRERHRLLAENAYVVLQERLNRKRAMIRRIRIYHALPQTRVIDLLALLSGGGEPVLVVESNGRCCRLGADEMCRLILTVPQQRLVDALQSVPEGEKLP